ncbi:MAG: GIY-YIG nuclease family protein [Candidatus Levybacteria bacterium]|nr:GIY-YIG nuclease family protein [Candidatus Levybacteria bacterium]
MSSRYYYVYILSNFKRTTLYTGITGNLVKRVYEHKNNLADGFSKNYYIHDLLYYEVFEDPTSAIEREKQIKSWSRKKKDELIIKFNPELKDLYGEII